MLSTGAQYAVSALIALAKEEEGHMISAADLAQPLNCPAAYLSQILSKLKPYGIVGSKRGMNGGVYLDRAPSDITILEVVTAIDGTGFFDNCFLGIAKCGAIEPCPFHDTWAEKRDQIKSWMAKTTFDDVIGDMSQNWFDLRLKFRQSTV